jgi:hypothetical protein
MQEIQNEKGMHPNTNAVVTSKEKSVRHKLRSECARRAIVNTQIAAS